eukprot:CAMPEP_0172821676 /NCGR_PEP_ID=MMETSP1075-20121228/16139_1 /TAXON_ID=2916 /ORGANISM="Ceratium fusus, Strain PA161109" /LENGTH=452 /DNA_ID=CAMNT_0013662567 /DNA_START=39 /DNA_END=1397 /DNA_ORIENTATION=-
MENSNTYTEVTEVSGGSVGGGGGIVSNICGAICCSIFGIGLFFAMLVMLAWNEQSTVCVSKAYLAAEQEYQTARCNSGPGSYSGALVHFSCPLNSESLPKWTSEDFGVSGDQLFSTEAVKVAQQVEMFQCAETVHTKTVKRGERTFEEKSYTYKKEWSSSHVDSSDFQAWQVDAARRALDNGCGFNFKGNPSFPIESNTLKADILVAGQYDLTRFMERISSSVPIKLKSGATVTLPGTSGTVSVDATQIFSGCKPGRPELGCIKVKYARSGTTVVSYLGRMQGDGTTRAWMAPSSWMCSTKGSSSRVDLFAQGSRDAEHMLESAQDENTMWTWVIRVLGFIVAYVGMRSFFAPAEALVALIDSGLDLFRFIPIVGGLLDFLGDVLRGAVGCAISIIAFGLSVPSCIMVVSVVWAIMRPLIAVPLQVLSCVGFYFTIMAMKNYAKEGQKKKVQ